MHTSDLAAQGKAVPRRRLTYRCRVPRTPVRFGTREMVLICIIFLFLERRKSASRLPFIGLLAPLKNSIHTLPADPALPHTDFPEKEIKCTWSLLGPFNFINRICLHRLDAVMVSTSNWIVWILTSCHDPFVRFLVHVLFLWGSNLCFHRFSMCFRLLLVFHFALCSSSIFTWLYAFWMIKNSIN